MPESFDVTSRLAEGRPAVADVEQLVWACQRLGYEHPDLTAHAGQLRDWYGSEDGLDLGALDADCAALSSAAAVAEDAAQAQTRLVAEIAGAWGGLAGVAARDFLSRHAATATAVSGGVRNAAESLTRLREALWRAVDAKVATVQAIDGRYPAQRAEWLAAARTVTTGNGDLATASELVDAQLKPFVGKDIGADWIAAMRTATASIDSAYAAAIAATSARPAPVFDVPGDIGPRPAFGPSTRDAGGGGLGTTSPASATMTPGHSSASVTPGPASAMMTAGATPPVAADPMPSMAATAPASAPLVEPPAALPVSPTSGSGMSSLGELGGGASGLGGLSGFGQQIADLIGGLFGAGDGMTSASSDLGAPDGVEDLDEPDDVEDDAVDDADADDDPEGGDEDEGEEDDEDEDPALDEDAPAEEPAADVIETGPEPEPAATPPPVPPPPGEPVAAPDVLPESVSATAEPTPCEIAADEIPQVGE